MILRWVVSILVAAAVGLVATTSAVASELPEELWISIGGARQKLTRKLATVGARSITPTIRSMPALLPTSNDATDVSQILLPDMPRVLVIVINSDLVEESAVLSTYVAWRRAGQWRVIVGTEADWDQPTFRDGDDRQARIRAWLSRMADEENAGYALLIGDPDPDSNGVPMRRTEPMARLLSYYPPQVAATLSQVPTDQYFADLDSDWDCDGDRVFGEYPDDAGVGCADWGPELIIGRIPVYRNDADELDAILNATLEYEQRPDKSYRNRALFAGAFGGFRGQTSVTGDSTYHEDEDLAVFLTRIADDLPNSVTPVRLFEDEGVVTSSFTHEGALSIESLLEAWMPGVATVAWGGHGSADGSYRMVWRDDDNGDGLAGDTEVWSPPFITGGAAAMLTETPGAFVHMMSCLNGYAEDPHNLGAVLLGRGAVATASASRSAVGETGPDWEPRPGLASATTNSYYFISLVQRGARAGDALAYTKWGLPGDQWHLYEDGGYDLLNAYGWLTKLEYNLYGDPTLSLERCEMDADCDDAPCTGVARCADGYCVHDNAVACVEPEDLARCETVACDNDTAACVVVPVRDGTACGGGLYCTLKGACANGVCVAAPRPCPAEDGYVAECSEVERECILTPIDNEKSRQGAAADQSSRAQTCSQMSGVTLAWLLLPAFARRLYSRQERRS